MPCSSVIAVGVLRGWDKDQEIKVVEVSKGKRYLFHEGKKQAIYTQNIISRDFQRRPNDEELKVIIMAKWCLLRQMVNK